MLSESFNDEFDEFRMKFNSFLIPFVSFPKKALSSSLFAFTNHGQVYCRVKIAYTGVFHAAMSLIVDNVLTTSRRS